MAGYFDNFPMIQYSLGGGIYSNPTSVRNIFFRVKILDSVQANSLIYYPYYVKENETPEDIAYKYYKDVTKHWVVLMANNMVDPQFDWPLSYDNFIKYLSLKYGSLAVTYNTIHHFEMMVSKQNNINNPPVITTFTIDQNTYDNSPGSAFSEVNLQDGTTVAITTTTSEIFVYDYESQLNENKRQINLISNQYISQIDAEFLSLTKPVS